MLSPLAQEVIEATNNFFQERARVLKLKCDVLLLEGQLEDMRAANRMLDDKVRTLKGKLGLPDGTAGQYRRGVSVCVHVRACVWCVQRFVDIHCAC